MYGGFYHGMQAIKEFDFVWNIELPNPRCINFSRLVKAGVGTLDNLKADLELERT